MALKKLPIGIQSFRQIITGNYTYVDKTPHAYDLIVNYKYVFLSRPRRFGKSLFVDTLHHIFAGNKELFKGLYIYDKYEFEKFPIIRISWSGNFTTQHSTELVAKDILQVNQERLGVSCTEETPDICFKQLIRKAYEKYGKPVVILIDEYDKPILDNIGNPEEAAKRRDFLRGMYVHIKDNDDFIRFTFLTGISKFSKASIFSGLNNLFDISLNSRFATVCGYTENDLVEVFEEHLDGADIEKVRQWYNGYNFLGEHVYNPFDILQFIANNFDFRPYWWESGTPFSLIELLRRGNYYLPELENLVVDSTSLGSFDIENLQIEALLFQAGYLTIKQVFRRPRGILYKLRVPNMEVQVSLNVLLSKYLTGKIDYSAQDELYFALEQGELDKFKTVLQRLFASIPYTNYVNNTISSYEGYYASVVYTYLAALGFRIIAEDVTDRGRIDLTLLARDKIYIIEFKVGTEKPALEQIKAKRYWEKYLSGDKSIYLIGINFDDKERNITRFEWEKL